MDDRLLSVKVKAFCLMVNRLCRVYELVKRLQLLKAIFGTNLAGQWESHVAAMALRAPVIRGTSHTGSAPVKPGIYHVCLNQPYIQMTQAMANTALKMHSAPTSVTATSTATVEHNDSSRFTILSFVLTTAFQVNLG